MAETATKVDKLRDYEMVYIISPDVPEERLDATIEGISKLITERGGSVPQVEKWGKRKLAYPIKRHLEGTYVLARFKLKPVASRELEARLEISDEILRHLLVRLDSE